MRILVTGGAGYIGSHAVRELKSRGYDVVIYDNLCTGFRELAKGHELVEGDIRDSAKLASLLPGFDAVMHFAASAYVGESVEHPRKYFDNNVLGGLSLLNSAVDAKVKKFIFSSTCAVYGVPAVVPITEDTSRNPVNPYGITKMLFERALETYSRAYGLKYVALRYFNAAGADESGEIGELHAPETHLIPLALAAVKGEIPHLSVFGDDYPTPDGTCIRDYIHVNDLADAHAQALEYLHRGGDSIALNLGTGKGSSVKEIVTKVEQVTGKKMPIKMSPRREGDPPSLVADPAKGQKILGWKAKRDIEKIIRDAWNWAQKSQPVTT
jgi:UDP-glucose-4-epimerase GalE